MTREHYLKKCATKDCDKPSIHYFECGGVGSYYCRECYRQIVALSTPKAEAEEPCPVCEKPLADGDTCATDIELGKCHAECLADSPTVDLKTGEPMDGPIGTFPHVAPKAEAVTVKPLEWGETSYGNPEVTTIVGVYRINESMAGGWSVVAGKLILKTSDGRVNFPTKDAAKAAAQADYEARILSAIDTSPVPALTDEAVYRAVRAHDREDASHRGEPDPWETDYPEEEMADRMFAMRLALIAAFPSKGGTNG